MITVFGSINLDQIGTVARLPGPGETVAGGSFSMAAGGKGANQALAARRAGARVRLVAATGTDAFAGPALADLEAAGVDLTGVRRVPGATGIAMILVDARGENCIAILPGANAALTPDDAEATLSGMQPGEILLLQQEIPQPATARALDLARERGVVAVLNAGPFLDSTPDLARRASIVIANESEFALLCEGGSQPLDALVRDWARQRHQTVIVTLGADGVRAATPTDFIAVPAPRITPVDTVGAGDTFSGYLAAGLAAGLDLGPALERATIAAGLACLKPGAQPAIPEAREVELALSSRSR